MVTVLFEINGKPVQPKDIAVPLKGDGLSSWGDIVHQKADDLKCPKCNDACHITIVLSTDDSSGFGHQITNVCHSEFLQLVNNALPLFLKRVE